MWETDVLYTVIMIYSVLCDIETEPDCSDDDFLSDSPQDDFSQDILNHACVEDYLTDEPTIDPTLHPISPTPSPLTIPDTAHAAIERIENPELFDKMVKHKDVGPPLVDDMVRALFGG
eukprot:742588_1